MYESIPAIYIFCEIKLLAAGFDPCPPLWCKGNMLCYWSVLRRFRTSSAFCESQFQIENQAGMRFAGCFGSYGAITTTFSNSQCKSETWFVGNALPDTPARFLNLTFQIGSGFSRASIVFRNFKGIPRNVFKEKKLSRDFFKIWIWSWEVPLTERNMRHSVDMQNMTTCAQLSVVKGQICANSASVSSRKCFQLILGEK